MFTVDVKQQCNRSFRSYSLLVGFRPGSFRPDLRDGSFQPQFRWVVLAHLILYCVLGKKKVFLASPIDFIDSVGSSGNLEHYPWQPHLEVKTVYNLPFSFIHDA